MTLLLPATLGATTLLALAGWRSATRRGDALQARYDEAVAELSRADEASAEFAGRCAWHAGNDPLSPPDHLLGVDHVEHYARGY